MQHKPKAHDPLKIQAETFSSMIDAAKAEKMRQQTVSVGPHNGMLPCGLVLVKNESGVTVGRFGVLGISGVVITEDANADEFKKRVVLTGALPTTAYYSGKFCILFEPLVDDAIGWAWVCGVCQVQIEVGNSAHAYADVTNANATKLTSAVAGGAQILWKESGTGTKWAVIRFVHSGLAHADICS